MWLICTQASATNVKETIGVPSREFNVAACIMAHLHNLKSAARDNDDGSGPFADLINADRSVGLLIQTFKTKPFYYEDVSVLLPHPYRDAVTQVRYDFLVNKQALNRVFAFRCCQSMRHLDLWDEYTLPPDLNIAFEAEMEPASLSNDTGAILDTSVALNKPKVKE